MKVSIIGSGYVGLVTGACLAELGHTVVCVDTNPEKVDAINSGLAPFHEKGINEILRRTVGKSLHANASIESSVIDSEITLIAGPTPFEGKAIDLTYIIEIANQVGMAIRRKGVHHVVVVKSTVIPGATMGVVREAIESAGLRCGGDFSLGMNPEFLSEGSAVEDFMRPDRIVIGTEDRHCQEALNELYSSFHSTPIVHVNCATAEMIKYASNSLQATMISFANEIASYCAAGGGIDVSDVMKGVHLMRELNVEGKPAPITNFLMAGCGFGGSCFPKDVKAFVSSGRSRNLGMPLLQSVLDINAQQPLRMVELLRTHIPDLRNERVAVLGLAFKPGTDDMRESPAVPIIHELIRAGAAVSAFDPVATGEARRIFSGQPLEIGGDIGGCIEGARAVLLVTRWPEFACLPGLLKEMTPVPLLVDGRRMIQKESVPRYAGIGL